MTSTIHVGDRWNRAAPREPRSSRESRTRFSIAFEIGLDWSRFAIGRAVGVLTAWLLANSCAFAVDPSAGPLFGIWHVDGHTYKWQADQIEAGYPLEPSIRLPGAVQLYTFDGLSQVSRNWSNLAKFDGGNIVLRMNNLTSELDATFHRFKLTEENWRESLLCIRRLPETGKLDDTPSPCPFGPTEPWAIAGERWAKSPVLRWLQERIPNPTGVILRENNEGGRLLFGHLCSTERGVLQWKSKADLDAISLRASEWVETKRGVGQVEDHQAEFEQADVEHYQALFAAFDAALSDGWRGKLRTVGYGGRGKNYQHDAASPNMYMGYYRPAVLTDPKHLVEWKRLRDGWAADNSNPRAWRELSIRMRGPTVFEGAQKGEHEIVDPESYGAYMAFGMWAMQSPGREVRMTYWERHATLPTKPLIRRPQQWSDAVVALGREDLTTVTVEDFERAVAQRMRQIHQSETLGRYWREGTTKVANSPLNDDAIVRVYATKTNITGATRSLLYVYSPCKLAGPVQVAGESLPDGFRRFGYYLTNPIEAVE